MSVLTNDGTGAFSPETNFTVGSGPESVAIADLNGDGRPDLAVANRDSNNVSTLLNTTPPTITIDDISVTEGDAGTANAVFTVHLSWASDVPVTLDYATTNGSATAGVDYQKTYGTLTFAPGQTARTIVVPINGDTLVEPNESFFVDLSDPTGGRILKARGTATIVIDDVAGTLQFGAPTDSVSENGGVATITVTRTGGSASGVTIDYATGNGTATAGSDFTPVTGTLVFAAGEMSKTFTIRSLDDSVAEPLQETITLTLSNPGGGGVLGSQNSAVLTIVDDEPRITATGMSLTAGKQRTFSGSSPHCPKPITTSPATSPPSSPGATAPAPPGASSSTRLPRCGTSSAPIPIPRRERTR